MIPTAKFFLAFYLDPPLIQSQGLLSKAKMINVGHSQLVSGIYFFVSKFKFFEDYSATLFIMNGSDIYSGFDISRHKKLLLFYYFVYLEYPSNIIFKYYCSNVNSVNKDSLRKIFHALDYASKNEEVFEWRKYIF